MTRIAISHDYLTQRGGAERLLLSICRAFPDATVHTLLYNPDTTYPELRDMDIRVSGLNRVRAFRADHRKALPFLAAAADSMHIDADLVVASSSGWAHGFPTSGTTLVYCHSPARWLYLSEEYLGGSPWTSPRGLALQALKPALLRWDQRAQKRAAAYLANSTVVSDRIRTVYRRRAPVLPPAVSVSADGVQEPIPELGAEFAEGFSLVVSRLLPYKNVQRVVEAFRGEPSRLLVIGDGPLFDELTATAPHNVRLVRGLSDAQMRWAYAHCRELIAASHEDFGLTPLEAGAFGKPTLALEAGGYLDTIVPGVNGTFFDRPEVESIREAVRANAGAAWDPARIQRRVEEFSEANFIERLREHVATAVR